MSSHTPKLIGVDTHALAALMRIASRETDARDVNDDIRQLVHRLNQTLARSTRGIVCTGCYALPHECARVVGHGQCHADCRHLKCCPDCSHHASNVVTAAVASSMRAVIRCMSCGRAIGDEETITSWAVARCGDGPTTYECPECARET